MAEGDYWIVDPEAKTVLIHRWPAGTADLYPLAGVLAVEAMTGLEIDLDRIDFS